MGKNNLIELKLENAELKKENFRLQKKIAKLDAAVVSSKNEVRAVKKMKGPPVHATFVLPEKEKDADSGTGDAD